MKFFTAEDFSFKDDYTNLHAAIDANTKLQRDAKVVYICDYPGQTTTIHRAKPVDATHTGLLICVEEIERKPCEHKDITKNYGIGYAKCDTCGVTLKEKWEVVDEQR